ncbi:hypothetical protein [Pedobacter sp. Hv1]|uniref:hypothetical protein n=1 Tax=Pedobacter sp. Hv1 TaxID=1740090 RepID=UPI0006D8CD1C|nr:hypothetical protein [Pedobacter sp. Hv1]
MKTAIITICLLLGMFKSAICQINVELLHQLVAESKSEHSRQDQAKNNQALTSANEEVNRGQMVKLKTKYRELKNRFHTVGLAIDAAQIGLEASPVISEIIRQQGIIYQLANDNPLLIVLAIQTETDLADRARMIANYIVALALSIGDINQMKASDRKMLFSHALTELRLIEGASKGLAQSMMQAGRKKSLNPFADFINQDTCIVDEIVRNAGILKNQ